MTGRPNLQNLQTTEGQRDVGDGRTLLEFKRSGIRGEGKNKLFLTHDRGRLVQEGKNSKPNRKGHTSVPSNGVLEEVSEQAQL